MKIELAMYDSQDRVWNGIARIECKLYKATIILGSINKEWQAILSEACFVELTEQKEPWSCLIRAYVEELAKDALGGNLVLEENSD